jgi:acetylglutamate kinase
VGQVSDQLYGQLFTRALGPSRPVSPAIARLLDFGFVGTLAPVGSDQKEEKNMIEAGSAALNLANLVTSIAANVTYLLQAWGVL